MLSNKKKVGLVSLAVAGALAAAAPMALAGDGHDRDRGPRGEVDARTCAFVSGDQATSGENGASLANVLAQAPITGNVGNIGNCSDFLNDNLSRNSILSPGSGDVQ
ncbi:hypothetical protein WIS52_17090 [Pseudonocardia nematodicida]|uniref:Secreted protein n=1 Tax=Pseudonocardia nematodicida TaxID=1206997 RepID=A0ABV1KCI8_9PSEU